MRSDRQLYQSWVKDLVADPHSKEAQEKIDGIKDVTLEDHVRTSPSSSSSS
jgi:hypothetical protein